MASSDSPAGEAESKDDAIIRVAAFRRKDHHLMPWLVDFDPKSPNLNLSQIPTSLPASIASPVLPTGVFAELGIFDKLPNELLTKVCRNLDIKSYLRFRQACRFLCFFMSSLAEFRVVVDLAASCLIGVIRTDMWRHLGFTDLFQLMCTVRCEVCSEIGHFLYMPTGTRCCRQCLHDRARFRTVTLASYARVSKFTQTKVQRLVPVVSSLRNRHRSLKLINFDEATGTMHTPPNLNVGIGYGSVNRVWQPFTRNMATTPLPFFDKSSRGIFETLNCKGCARNYSQTAITSPVMQIIMTGNA